MVLIVAGMAAFVVDLGYLCVVQTQAQAAADAAALAGARGLTTSLTQVVTDAQNCASLNVANNQQVTLQSSDIVVGTWNLATQTFSASSGTVVNGLNAVQVTVNLTATRGNPVSLFFANVFGVSSANITASAIAGVKRWDVVLDQDITPSFADDLPYAVQGQQEILADFNQYSPTSELGVVQFTGWGSTWASLQPVGSNYSTLNATIGNLKDSLSPSTTAYNVYGGTATSIAVTTLTPNNSDTDLSTGIQQSFNMLTDPNYLAGIPPETSRAIIIVSDGENVPSPYGQHPSSRYTANQLNTLSQQAASAAWAQGISIFVILYYHGSDSSADTALLKSLVRGQGTFTQVTDGSSLPSTLNQLFMNSLKYELYQ